MTRSVTRAREVDALVAEIADRMVAGRWVPGRSHRELATREGVTDSAVEKWAAAAGRMLRMLSPAEREELRARNAARLDVLYDMAVNAVEVVHRRDSDPEVVPQPDIRGAVAAIAEQGKLLGLNAPEKHQHAHVVATYEQLDPRAKRAQLVEAIAVLQAELAALPEGE